MKVAVLGAGPSGLLAAWAVVNAGHEPVILEKSIRKPDGSTAGVYYLHSDCDLPLRRREVEVLVSGGKDSGYRRRNYERKVYGTSDVQPVSIPDAPFVDVAYDGMQAMELCWDIVSPFIQQEEIKDWTHVLATAKCHELVINTIPLSLLLRGGSWLFEYATIYRGIAPADESYMMYQANPAIPWYRASAIFGAFTLEYPGNPNPAVEKDRDNGPPRGRYVRVQKVIDSPLAMPEVPENVLLTGRFGAWSKSKLSHHAYEDAMRRLTQ